MEEGLLYNLCKDNSMLKVVGWRCTAFTRRKWLASYLMPYLVYMSTSSVLTWQFCGSCLDARRARMM